MRKNKNMSISGTLVRRLTPTRLPVPSSIYTWRCEGSAPLRRSGEAEVLGVEALLVDRPVDGLHVEARLLDPLVVHHLAHVVPGGVGEEHSDAFVLPDVVLLDEAVRTRHGGAAAAADEQALMSDNRAHRREGLVVVGLHPVVGDLPV